MSLDMAVHSHGIQCSNKKKKEAIQYIILIAFVFIFCIFFTPIPPQKYY